MPLGKYSAKVAAVRALAAEAGLSEVWGDFFALVAFGESRGNPESINDSPKEAEAAARAYRRNAHRLEHCGHAPQQYTFGSGGWFGFLPANAVLQLGPDHRCIDPASVFEPRKAMAMAVGFARGLMRWKRFERVPTWLNLRVMWGSPTEGGDAGVLRRARAEITDGARAVGIPAERLDETPPPLPTPAAEILRRLNPEGAA